MSTLRNICVFILILSSSLYAGDRIKLYSYYTPSHRVLKEKYFEPSIKDDYEVIIRKIDEQVCKEGYYKAKNWELAVAQKALLIIDAIKENWGSYFIYSDIDIQFLRPTKDYITKHFKDLDLLAQKASASVNSKSRSLCSGFMVIKAHQENLDLWKDIYNHLVTPGNKNGDQFHLNRLIKKHKLTYDVLPSSFYNPGRMWRPGKKLTIPDDIMLHHANWCFKMNWKCEQLDYIQSLFKQQSQ
jgi:hypothetical protein